MVDYLLRVIDLLASLASSEQKALYSGATELLKEVVLKAKEHEELKKVLLLVNPLPNVPSLVEVTSHLEEFAESEDKDLKQVDRE